ncbi:MAG: glutathione S-transferase N-terminal domain-containing protein [Stagnimonas sp.]|nr:glutathione S-transferase N-terminal domain-containing protein [Stagnimonas sp.]
MSATTDACINLLAGTLRGWRGSQAFAPARKQPAKLLKLYDIEASPYCRLVREVLTELDLDVLILPCPVGGRRFRPEAVQLGGKSLFPLLVDDNTGTLMYESADIIDYLGQTYQRRTRGHGPLRPLAVASSWLSSATLWRPGRGVLGMRAQPSVAPAQPLELFSFEASPYSRRVRARLCELELPYRLRNTGKGAWKDMGPPSVRDQLFKSEQGTTRNRRWLAEHTGQVQLPYLVDPNTGTAMYESDAILRYLDTAYAKGAAA